VLHWELVKLLTLQTVPVIPILRRLIAQAFVNISRVVAELLLELALIMPMEPVAGRVIRVKTEFALKLKSLTVVLVLPAQNANPATAWMDIVVILPAREHVTSAINPFLFWVKTQALVILSRLTIIRSTRG